VLWFGWAGPGQHHDLVGAMCAAGPDFSAVE
jgi:hypothetical protein